MEFAGKLGTKSPLVWQCFGLAVDEDRQVKSEDQAICQRTVMPIGTCSKLHFKFALGTF